MRELRESVHLIRAFTDSPASRAASYTGVRPRPGSPVADAPWHPERSSYSGLQARCAGVVSESSRPRRHEIARSSIRIKSGHRPSMDKSGAIHGPLSRRSAPRLTATEKSRHPLTLLQLRHGRAGKRNHVARHVGCNRL